MKELIIIQGGEKEYRQQVTKGIATELQWPTIATIQYVEYERMDCTRQAKVWDIQNAPGLPQDCPKDRYYDTVLIWGCTLATVAELLQLAAPFVARRIVISCDVPVPGLGELNNDHSTVTITKKILA
jgi:hypothetical protein